MHGTFKCHARATMQSSFKYVYQVLLTCIIPAIDKEVCIYIIIITQFHLETADSESGLLLVT